MTDLTDEAKHQRARLGAARDRRIDNRYPHDGSPLFYILDIRSCVGNCALWWRPNGQGYTTELSDAGLFMHGSRRDTDVEIPEAMAEACAVTHVRVEALRVEMEKAGIPWGRQ